MKQRVYYSEEQWKAWMTECCNSGLKIKDWCEQHGLSDNLFFRWRKRLLDQGKIVWKPSVNTTNTGNDQLPAVVQVNLSDLSDDIPWMVGYSGGKDSTAALQLVWMSIGWRARHN